MTNTLHQSAFLQRGFTLAELAIVVVIVGLLLGGLLSSYSNQVELSRISETKKTLETARDALVGFAASNGRLPCPATTASNGVEMPPGGVGPCTVSTGSEVQGVGFVPAATLALTPVDSQGYLLDAWGNRIRYAVTNDSANFSFTTQGQVRTQLLDGDPATPATTLLRVCSTSIGMTGAGTAAAVCGGTSSLTNSAVAVLFSIGKNGVPDPASTKADELMNLDNDRVFISHSPTPTDTPAASGGEFDDIVIWLSPPILYNRILSGGL